MASIILLHQLLFLKCHVRDAYTIAWPAFSSIFHSNKTTNLLHSLGLSSRSYTADRETDVDGRSDTLEEQFTLQEDLSVSDGDNIGWNVSRYITSLESSVLLIVLNFS